MQQSFTIEWKQAEKEKWKNPKQNRKVSEGVIKLRSSLASIPWTAPKMFWWLLVMIRTTVPPIVSCRLCLRHFYPLHSSFFLGWCTTCRTCNNLHFLVCYRWVGPRSKILPSTFSHPWDTLHCFHSFHSLCTFSLDITFFCHWHRAPTPADIPFSSRIRLFVYASNSLSFGNYCPGMNWLRRRKERDRKTVAPQQCTETTTNAT